MSADTIVPGAGDPQALNRYAYVLNNPLRYNDPTGHDVGCSGRDASHCSSYNRQRAPSLPNKNYIKTRHGAVIDRSHVTDELARKLFGELRGLLLTGNGGIFMRHAIGNPLAGARRVVPGVPESLAYKVEYQIAGLTENNLEATAFRLYFNYTYRLESRFQGQIFLADVPKTVFSPEDMPSYYVGFLIALSEYRGTPATLEQIVNNDLGGVASVSDTKTDFVNDSYRNRSFDPMLMDGSIAHWPSSLDSGLTHHIKTWE